MFLGLRWVELAWVAQGPCWFSYREVAKNHYRGGVWFGDIIHGVRHFHDCSRGSHWWISVLSSCGDVLHSHWDACVDADVAHSHCREG